MAGGSTRVGLGSRGWEDMPGRWDSKQGVPWSEDGEGQHAVRAAAHKLWPCMDVTLVSMRVWYSSLLLSLSSHSPHSRLVECTCSYTILCAILTTTSWLCINSRASPTAFQRPIFQPLPPRCARARRRYQAPHLRQERPTPSPRRGTPTPFTTIRLHTATTNLRNNHRSTTRTPHYRSLSPHQTLTPTPQSADHCTRLCHEAAETKDPSSIPPVRLLTHPPYSSTSKQLPNSVPFASTKAILTTTRRQTQSTLRHTLPTPYHPTRLNALSQRHFDSRSRLHPRHHSTHRSRLTPFHCQHCKEEEKEQEEWPPAEAVGRHVRRHPLPQIGHA